MRISDWSSDVCSSDLTEPRGDDGPAARRAPGPGRTGGAGPAATARRGSGVTAILGRPRGCGGGRIRAEGWRPSRRAPPRSEEHTSELQSLMRISYAVFCLKKKTTTIHQEPNRIHNKVEHTSQVIH